MFDFKSSVQKDIQNVFFNTKEGAEERIVEGVKMPVIVDDERLQELKAKSQYADGIGTAELLIFVQRRHLGFRPGIGGMIHLDGETYRVAGVSGDTVLELILEANG